MLPTLRHIPPRAITHLPGPRNAMGSKLPRVAFGPIFASLTSGMPDAATVLAFYNATAGQPTWFAISDFGAGYVPWGFWEVAVYPQGDTPAGLTENLAFGIVETVPGAPSSAVAGSVYNKFLQLQAQGIAAGFTAAAKLKISLLVTPGTGGNPDRGTVVIKGPFGVTLKPFYSGNAGDPMYTVEGYDNPLFVALWSPGNRAILKATEPAGPNRYRGYYYPHQPPPGPFVG
jgi:hypothetical protein